jgi:Uma2 family endonuclease
VSTALQSEFRTVALLPGMHSWTVDSADEHLGQDTSTCREVVDGELVMRVTGSTWRHEDAVLLIASLLRMARPAGWSVTASGLDVRLPWGDVVEPDVVVLAPEAFDPDLGSRAVTAAPALVVEVRSPSTASRDQVAKRALYARYGVASYWLVDPELRTITVLELGEDGTYAECVTTEAGQPLTVTTPYDVTIDWTV